MINAAFTVNGASNPAAHSVSYESTVNLELLSYTGVTSIVWEIMACSDADEPIPSITISGTPPGRTASFVMPVDSTDSLGRAFLVRCTVSSELIGSSGSRETSVQYAVIGALNSRSILPIVPGEENYRNGTHGWAPEINIALNNTASGGGGGGDVIGPVSSVNNNIVVFNGTGGDSIKDGGIGVAALIHADGSVAHTANQPFGSHRITGLADGVSSSDAATKGQVDAAIAAGISTVADFKQSVRAATTTNISLTGNPTIDGVVLTTGDRVLVKNQSTGSQNGIYITAAGSWTRSTDSDANAEVTCGLTVVVEEGTNNGGRIWILTTPNPIVVGSTSLSFSAITGVTAGNGLTGTGTLSVLIDGSTLSVSASGVKVAAGGITETELANNSVNLTTKVTGLLPLSNIADLAALAVLGRATGTSGVMAPITGSADGVLRINSSNTSLGFGQISAGGIASDAVTTVKILDSNVTLAKIANGTALSILGRSVNSSGVYADIVAASDGQIIRRNGNTVGFGSIDLSLTAAVGISLLALANIAGATGNTGKALISNGTNWAAGTDFGSNVLITTGALTLGLPAGSGSTVASCAATGNIRGSRGSFLSSGGTGFQISVRNNADTSDVAIFAWDSTNAIVSVGGGVGTSISHIDLACGGDWRFRNATGTTVHSWSTTAFTGILSSFNIDSVTAGTSAWAYQGAGSATGHAWTFAGQAGTATGGLMSMTAGAASGSSGTCTGGALTFQGGSATGAGATHIGGILTLAGGDATGATGTRTGADIIVRSGTGATADGNTYIERGTTIAIQLAKPSSGLVIGLARTSAITSTQMPSNSGDGVVYIGARATAPTVAPVSGLTMYATSSGELVTVSTDNVTLAMKLGNGSNAVRINAGGPTDEHIYLDSGSGNVTLGPGAMLLDPLKVVSGFNSYGISYMSQVLVTLGNDAGTKILGFFGSTPASQATDPVALTASFGTADNTIADVGATHNQTTLNDNFKDLATKYNLLRDIVRRHGLSA